MKLRPHQSALLILAAKIASGEHDGKLVTAGVCPGGGKTIAAIIFALALYRAGIIRRVLHIVPRDTLKDQIEEAWRALPAEFNPEARSLMKIEVNKSPLYDTSVAIGGVAGYGQLSNNQGAYVAHASHVPTLTIFDEAQFLSDPDKAAWARAAVKLSAASRCTLMLSGTIWRHDGNRIPIVEYEDRGGEWFPKVDVSYGLREAIADLAVKPADFTLLDGRVEWLDDDEDRTAVLSTAETDDESRALRTFLLRPETWQGVVDRAIDHWRAWKANVRRSRLIVVALDQAHARKIHAYVEQRHRLGAALVISDEKAAHDDVTAFRRDGRPDVLVTVAMASVGFDCPDCTHMAYLTNVRSLPWALQAFARVTRIDGQCHVPARAQRAHIFAPNDTKLRAIRQWMRDEQDQGLADVEDDDEEATPAEDREASSYTPIAATPLGVTFDAQDLAISPSDSARISAWYEAHPGWIGLCPPLHVLDLIGGTAGPAPREPAPRGAASGTSASGHAHDARPVTLTERRKKKRDMLRTLTSRRDKKRRLEPGGTNKDLFRLDGTHLHAASEAQIDARIATVRKWLANGD